MELTLVNVRRCPRVAKRCGTNFVIFMFPFLLVGNFFIAYSSVVLILALTIAYELFNLEDGDKLFVLKWFFKLGGWCQQHLSTEEPTDLQIMASIATVKKLLSLQDKIHKIPPSLEEHACP